LSRVFLLEDHAVFRRSLAFLLEREPHLEVVAEAGSLAEARQTTSKEWDEIDIAIVDLLLPDGSGTELIGEIREANPSLRVLALTIVQDPKSLERAQAMGVDEVISKAAPTQEIVGGVKRLVGTGE
jgi:DNA-binding NarL/FixJ family response regulator